MKQRRCLRCGRKRPLTKDHIVPAVVLRERGIPHHAHNVQKLCAPCNQRKGRRLVDYRSIWFHDQLLWWMDHVGLDDLVGDMVHEPGGYCVGTGWAPDVAGGVS